jgi:hypothetical protein
MGSRKPPDRAYAIAAGLILVLLLLARGGLSSMVASDEHGSVGSVSDGRFASGRARCEGSV